MIGVVSVERAKQVLILLLVAALALTSVLLIRGSDAEAGTQSEIGLDVLFEVTQVDIICTHRITGVDRVRASAPLILVIDSILYGDLEENGFGFDLEEFIASCSRYETTRISLSLNGDLLIRFASEGYD